MSNAKAVVLALSESIRELGEVPSGHLYAQVMSIVSIDEFTAMVRTLKGAGLVAESGNVLRWVGPRIGKVA